MGDIFSSLSVYFKHESPPSTPPRSPQIRGIERSIIDTDSMFDLDDESDIS